MNPTTEWYDTTAVTPNSRLITEAPVTLPSNSYLVSGSERNVLFDTGLGVGDLKGLLSEVTESDCPTRVVLSHFHWDHIGNAHRFEDVWIHDRERRADGAVAIDALSSEFVDRPQQFVATHRERERPFPDGFDPDTFDVPAVETVSSIDPATSIPLGNRELEVVEIPGHSPGQIALLDERDGVLYGADLVHIETNAYLHFQDSSLEAYIESLTGVIDLYEDDRFETLVTGHNPPLAGEELDVLYTLEDALRSVADGEREGERVETDWGDALKHEAGESVILTKLDPEDP